MKNAMKIIVASFGFKFGTPNDADALFDARVLRNPFRDPHLRKLSGLDDKVWHAIVEDRRFQPFMGSITVQAVEAIEEGFYKQLVFGVGCTGGRHRSVVCTMELARALWWRYERKGMTVQVAHRDLNKGVSTGSFINARDYVPTPKPVRKQFNEGQRG